MLSGEGGGGEGEGWIFYFIFYFFLVAATVGLQGAGRAAAAAVAYDVYSVELGAVRCIFWWKSPCGVSDGARASWRMLEHAVCFLRASCKSHPCLAYPPVLWPGEAQKQTGKF